MSRIINALDLFGDNFTIYFNHREKINTKFGGYLTILIVLITVIFVWFIGKDIIYKANPFNYQQQIANKVFLNNTINKTTFPLAFALVDTDNIPLKNSSTYLNFELKYVTYNFNNGSLVSIKEEPITISSCNYDDFPKLPHEEFDKAQLKNFVCPQNDSILLYGYWSENSVGYLSAVVKLCDFDQPNNECGSYEEIQDYIAKTSANLGLSVLEPQIVISNYSQPLQKYVTNPYKFFENNLKFVNYFVEKNVIHTDAGIIFETETREEFFKLKEFQTDTALYDPTTKIVLKYNFYSSNLETIYVRKYIKIPEILASAGGLFKVFTLVGYYLNLSFSEIYKNLTTISCLFKFEGEDVGVNKPKLINNFYNDNSLRRTINQLSSNFHLHNKDTPKEFLASNINIESIMHKIRSRKPALIKFTTSDYINLICRRVKNISKDVKLYQQALTRIKDYFDIMFIINKLIEVDIMKTLILTDNQKIVLESIKPILTEDQGKYLKVTNIEEELGNFFRNPNKTDIDHKLLKLLTSFN